MALYLNLDQIILCLLMMEIFMCKEVEARLKIDLEIFIHLAIKLGINRKLI